MRQKYSSNRIRQLRKERGLTMEKLALAISEDTALTTIGKLENGQMALSLDWMRLIAPALGVAVVELIEEQDGYRMLPLLGAIAAGTWSEAVQHAERWIPVPGDEWSGREFVLSVNGDSMNDVAEDGDYVVVDPARAVLENGKMYAVMNGSDETTFKRFEASPPSLVPCSKNRDHVPILLGSEPFTVIGRVTRVVRNLD